MIKELSKLTTKQLIKLVKTFEHYSSVTLKDGKDYILSYLEDEACTISKKEIAEYLLKNGVEINQENIHLYYEFIDSDVLSSHKRIMRNIIYNRKLYVFKYFCLVVSENNENEIHWKYLDYTKKYLGHSIFGVKDNLKPIDEYIAEIKNSNIYKEYRFNNLVKTYDLSIRHLKQLEHELFADDSTYISNIDNLIYSALDKIADDFKLNVIDYIEDNCLQESTGLSCISDIEVIIKDGEYQGIFKEFESYGLNDFSVQNITLFINRYKEIKESVKYDIKKAS